jgi:hypothetical protein
MTKDSPIIIITEAEKKKGKKKIKQQQQQGRRYEVLLGVLKSVATVCGRSSCCVVYHSLSFSPFTHTVRVSSSPILFLLSLSFALKLALWGYSL